MALSLCKLVAGSLGVGIVIVASLGWFSLHRPPRIAEIEAPRYIVGSQAPASSNGSLHRHSASLAEAFEWPSSKVTGFVEHEPTERAGMPKTKALLVGEILGCLHKALVPLSGYVLNVGAGDGCMWSLGIECDDSNMLLHITNQDAAFATARALPARQRVQELLRGIHFSGLLVEPGSLSRHHLRQWYAGDGKVQIEEQALTVDAVKHQLGARRVPRDLDLLKYDTDSEDCSVVDAILTAGYQPKVLMLEYNLLFPPPLLFNLENSRGTLQWGVQTPHWQQLGNECSLSHLSRMLQRHGYVLLQVDFWDAYYVHQSVAVHATAGTPFYDDLTWWLHGYAGQVPEDQRVAFLKKTAFVQATLMAPEIWTKAVVGASKAGLTRVWHATNLSKMESEFRTYCVDEGAVPRDVQGNTIPYFLGVAWDDPSVQK